MQGRVDQEPALGPGGAVQGSGRGVGVEQEAQSGQAVLAAVALVVLADDQNEGAGVQVVEGGAGRLDGRDGAVHGRAGGDDGEDQIAPCRRVEDIAGIADAPGGEGRGGIAEEQGHTVTMRGTALQFQA
ncbi:MAG: hypothetical protein EON88_27655 [Brevundimonas sp.]|nr:MAG: hypothetical protein EON88_27655 [Brevundimonas sp.]